MRNPLDVLLKGATLLYLKRVFARDGYHYILSESHHDEGCWKHRPLMDMGSDPGVYIEYPGGNSFHVKESLLMPFLDPHIRRMME